MIESNKVDNKNIKIEVSKINISSNRFRFLSKRINIIIYYSKL
jgi:hypothetical protein